MTGETAGPGLGTLLALMLAGGLGAAARYAVDTLVTHGTGSAFPWGTMAVNLSASFLLGLVFALTTRGAGASVTTRLILMTGFIGSYSTFSTLMLDSVRLFQSGAFVGGITNLSVSVGAGLLGVLAGLGAGRPLG